MALLEWSRAAELSCDRAAALVTRDPQAVCRALMVMSAGEAADDLNLDAFIAQGDGVLGGRLGAGAGHEAAPGPAPHPPDAGAPGPELLDWVREGDYDRMVRGDYLREGEEPSAREEAEATIPYYTDRIGSAIQAAGSSVSEVGQQLGDWLKRTKANPADEPPPP